MCELTGPMAVKINELYIRNPVIQLTGFLVYRAFIKIIR